MKILDLTDKVHGAIHHAVGASESDNEVLLILGAAFLDACLTHGKNTDDAVNFLRDLADKSLPEMMN